MFEKTKCIIEHCPNMGRVRSRYCHACSNSFYYWEKKTEKFGVAVILERQTKLEKWQDRMTYLGSRDKEIANVARKIAKRRA